MLLDSNDVRVRGGEFRLFDYIIARLELRGIDNPPTIQSAIFAVVTLGSHNGGEPVSFHTNSFNLRDVAGWDVLYQQWRRNHACGRVDYGFLESLLRYFQTHDFFSLEFLCEDGLLSRFVLRLDVSIELRGRVPLDTDILSAYFEAVTVSND